MLHWPGTSSEMMNLIWLIPLAWLTVVSAILLWYRRELLAAWREPVLRHPVLIIESDDWGAGPVEAQARALHQLVELLTKFKDRTGRHPVMTLALVLAVPDGPSIRRDGRYHRLTLEDPMFAPVREAIERGRAAGVFALQLHGLEHYWPDALMASPDPAVRAWLEGDAPAITERLPSPLQSRWTDASVLPSRPLPPERIAAAVAEEVRLYERIFGERPRVAVPPTFVWNEAVERAWAREGIEFVVTPGLRSACRNADGVPDCDAGPFHNGLRGAGVGYVVRPDYLEPERGHRAERALAALAARTAEGRACLLETHRSNFIADVALSSSAFEAIHQLYNAALQQNQELRFPSTAELGDALRPWRVRIRAIRRFWRLARVSGLAWLLPLPS
ncbi:MAG: hypothetical protein MUC79_00010 [Thiobacillaceae bacterium]|nr:hypothetical protein [Thiobacillaceae bacterium]